MAFTETTETSFFGNIKNAFAGIITGLVLFIAGFPILWMNEGCSVRNYKTLKDVRENTVAVAADTVDSANEGKLVHVSGPTATKDTVSDPQFGITENAIRLSRSAQIYQYKENSTTKKKDKVGGGTKNVTTYTYEKVWSNDTIPSSGFKESGHENTGSIPYPSNSWRAKNVTLAAYKLSNSLASQINNSEKYDATTAEAPENIAENAKPHNGGFYIGNNPSDPQIGDVKISFTIVRPSTASVLAQQNGTSFEPYISPTTEQSFEMLKVGEFTAEAMITQKEKENKIRTWAVRAAGIFALFLGLTLIFKPLSVLGNVIPFIGSIIEGASAVVAGIMALMFGTMTIGAAWVYYRPLLGIPLLLVSVGCLVMLIMRKKKASAMQEAVPVNAAPPPPPPPPA